MPNFFSEATIKKTAGQVADWLSDPIGTAFGLDTFKTATQPWTQPWRGGQKDYFTRVHNAWGKDWDKIKGWMTPGMPDMRRDREAMTNDALQPRRLIYGTCRVSGQIAYMETGGLNNADLHMIVLIAGHEVEELGQIYLDDKAIEDFANPSLGQVYAIDDRSCMRLRSGVVDVFLALDDTGNFRNAGGEGVFVVAQLDIEVSTA